MNSLRTCVKKVNIHLTSQCFHTTAISCGIGNIMKKVMGQSSKKKHHRYVEDVVQPVAKVFSNQVNVRKRDSKRIHVLNKLFMRYVTDLMSSSEFGEKMYGHRIEINRMKVSPDFMWLHIYWFSSSTSSDPITEKLLEANSGLLRHELTQLNIIGSVPKIKFIKDKQHAVLTEINERLKKADYGEDYIPVDLESMLMTNLELNVTFSQEIKEKLQEIEELDVANNDDEDMPPMPQNVLGLNHDDIMNKVKKSMTQAQAKHRYELIPSESTKTNSNFVIPSNKSTKLALQEFLKSRKILKKKARLAEKKLMETNYTYETTEMVADAELRTEDDDEDYIDDDNTEDEPTDFYVK